MTGINRLFPAVLLAALTLLPGVAPAADSKKNAPPCEIQVVTEPPQAIVSLDGNQQVAYIDVSQVIENWENVYEDVGMESGPGWTVQ